MGWKTATYPEVDIQEVDKVGLELLQRVPDRQVERAFMVACIVDCLTLAELVGTVLKGIPEVEGELAREATGGEKGGGAGRTSSQSPSNHGCFLLPSNLQSTFRIARPGSCSATGYNGQQRSAIGEHTRRVERGSLTAVSMKLPPASTYASSSLNASSLVKLPMNYARRMTNQPLNLKNVASWDRSSSNTTSLRLDLPKTTHRRGTYLPSITATL